MLLRMYHAIPQRVRVRMVGLFTPSRSDRVVGFLARGGLFGILRSNFNHIRFKRSNAPFLRDNRNRVVTDRGSQLTVARTAADITPLSVRRSNERIVTELLDRISVPYFTVKGKNPTKARIGVNSLHRDAVLEALATTWTGTPTYVRGSKPSTKRMTVGGPHWPAAIQDSRIVEVFQPQADPGGTLVLGVNCACNIEFWSIDDEQPDQLVAPRDNRVTLRIDADQPVVTAPESIFHSLLQDSATPTVNTVSDFATSHIDDVQFPIDVVYTWVDGADPHWQERKAAALDQIGAARDINEFAANASRF